MGYERSPMSEFNKSNPLVILSKREYSNIMDLLQAGSKDYVKRIIAIAVLLIFLIGETALSIFYVQECIVPVSICVGFGIVFAIVYLIYYRHVAILYLHKHRGMREFNRISDMELNEIIKIGHEEILSCLHGLYHLKGGLEVHLSVLKFIGNIIIGFEILGVVSFGVLFYLFIGV